MGLTKSCTNAFKKHRRVSKSCKHAYEKTPWPLFQGAVEAEGRPDKENPGPEPVPGKTRHFQKRLSDIFVNLHSNISSTQELPAT